MSTAGPGASLAQRLGLGPGTRAWFLDMPSEIRQQLLTDAPQFELLSLPEPPLDLAHVFVRQCALLDCELRMLLPLMADRGTIWVSWPTGKPVQPTDISEEVVRALARPLHLTDVDALPLGENWSSLKLVTE